MSLLLHSLLSNMHFLLKCKGWSWYNDVLSPPSPAATSAAVNRCLAPGLAETIQAILKAQHQYKFNTA